MKSDKYNMIAVSALFLFLHCCAQAGIKGGTLFIKNVIPAVYEQINRQDGYVRSTIETLTLTDNRRFACLHIEAAIDWADNDKATEHTITRDKIKLLDQNGNEFPPIGRHAGNGDFIESISSHIHLQRDDTSRYFGDLIFAIPAVLERCTLQIEKAGFRISLPARITKPLYQPIARFKVIDTALLDHVPGGQTPKPKGLVEYTIKPVTGKILEVTLEIEPLISNRQSTASEGFYSDKKTFSFYTNDIGILFDDALYLDSIAAEMNGMAYNRVGSYQRFRNKWLTVTKKMCFCVPEDLKDFRVTYNKRPVAEVQVDSG